MEPIERIPPRAHSLGLPTRDHVAWRSLPDLPALADFDLNDLTATQLQLLYTQERALASGMSRHTTHYGYATLQTPGLFDGPDSPSLHRRSAPNLARGSERVADHQLNYLSLPTHTLPLPVGEPGGFALSSSPLTSYSDIALAQRQQLNALLSPQMLLAPPATGAAHPYAASGPRRRSSPSNANTSPSASPGAQRRATSTGANMIKISERIAEQKRRQQEHEAKFAEALSLTSTSTTAASPQFPKPSSAATLRASTPLLDPPTGHSGDLFASSPSFTISQPELAHMGSAQSDLGVSLLLSPSERASVGDLSGSLLFGSLDTSGLLLGPMTDQPPPLALNQLGELPNMLSQSDISMLLAQIQLEQSSAPASQSDAGSLMYNFGQPMSGSMGAPQMPVAGAADLDDDGPVTAADIDAILKQLAST